jgi:hypothetical protein
MRGTRRPCSAGSTISACECRRTASARWTFPTTCQDHGVPLDPLSTPHEQISGFSITRYCRSLVFSRAGGRPKLHRRGALQYFSRQVPANYDKVGEKDGYHQPGGSPRRAGGRTQRVKPRLLFIGRPRPALQPPRQRPTVSTSAFALGGLLPGSRWWRQPCAGLSRLKRAFCSSFSDW